MMVVLREVPLTVMMNPCFLVLTCKCLSTTKNARLSTEQKRWLTMMSKAMLSMILKT